MTENWEESSLFTSGNYTMIGEEGGIGFIFGGNETSKHNPDKIQKYMCHFWGSEEEFTVIGVMG
ncbi:hypothetical protein [Cytobacillus purgationiresistens]|uniref:Uncharacterized protein n=1 Tax=Cytobacillus purgationiresistens TaxID=863449 RepID=A0ABU0AR57_9BACI|nr:hypothetical protein [Cytobacillus purgationiresistens]MDQ0273262.1 hypothetical protein [Cytobacillus purgationiresistens]